MELLFRTVAVVLFGLYSFLIGGLTFDTVREKNVKESKFHMLTNLIIWAGWVYILIQDR